MLHASSTGTIIVGVGSSSDSAYAKRLTTELASRGFTIWSDEAIRIGQSRIQALDDAILDASALIVIRSCDTCPDEWDILLQHAFRAKIRTDTTAKLFVITRGRVLLESSVLTQAAVLPCDVGAEDAANIIAATLTHCADLSSFQLSGDGQSGKASLLKSGSWATVRNLGESFHKYHSTILSLCELGEYEHALDLYWRVLYYSGYRELWGDRLVLSGQLLKLSRERRDQRTFGLICCKGVAYAYLSTGQSENAFHALQKAYDAFNDDRDRRGKGIVWSYLGDLVSAHDPKLAMHYFDEAKGLLRGIEKRQTTLKKELLQAIHSYAAIPRIRLLQRLRTNFREIGDYREAITGIHLAQTLHQLGDYRDALAEAEHSQQFFSMVIQMPRNEKWARQVLMEIQTRKLLP